MGEGLSWIFGAKGILALALIVVLIVGYGRAPKIVQAAMETVDRNLEAVGINIIDIPKILSLAPSVEPDGSVAVTWKLNRDGQKIDDQYFKAVFSYKKYPDLIDDADNLMDDVCTVKHIDQKTAKPGWTCSVENGKRTAGLKKEDCTGPDCLDKLAGLYKIGVSFEKKEGFTTRKGEMETYPLFGFYTEAYVELLDRAIAGCYDGWGNCNVVECKKDLVNYNLAGGAQGGLPTWLGVRKELVPEIAADFKGQDFVKLFGKSLSPDCGDFSEGAVRLFKADTCTPQELDLLNRMIVRARLLETAYSASGNTIVSEDKYIGQLDKLDAWKKTAVKYTMSCAVPLNRFITTDPKGAYSEFEKLGWQRFPETGGFNEWENKVNAELDRVLRDELNPAIANLRAEVSPSKAIALKWDVIGYGNIDHYEVEHCWRKYARDKHFVSDAGDVELAGEESLCDPVNKRPNDVNFAIVPAGAPAGMHSFVLKAVKKGGGEITEELKVGFFVNDYIELYKGVYGYPNYKDKSKRGIITVCVRKPGATKDDNCDNDPNPKDGNLAECDKACDVFEEKRSAFKLNKVPIGGAPFDPKAVIRDEVFEDWKKGKTTSCEYKKTDAGQNTRDWELVGCSPEDVSQLYEALVKKAYPSEPWAGFYSCTPRKTDSVWEVNWQKTNLNKFDVNHEPVCKDKGELAKSLGNSNRLNWVYFAS